MGERKALSPCLFANYFFAASFLGLPTLGFAFLRLRLLGAVAKASSMAFPISAGEMTTLMPAASRAWVLSSAVPFPPEIIAPACPILRPGGAVLPAINPTTGFLTYFLIYSAAVSSAFPPISPIIRIAHVSGSSLNNLIASINCVPIIGSPPIPKTVD